MDDLPDVVYVVKPGERNDALRYSLRSLAHLPHRRVIIAGYCPAWVKDTVTKVHVRRHPNKFTSIENNLRAALKVEGLREHCVYFNDDFYVMRPVDRPPIFYRDTDNYHPTDELGWRYKKTMSVLPAQARCYDGTHTPMAIVRDDVLLALHRSPPGVLWRTWYGNMFAVGGQRTTDVKVRGPRDRVPSGPFLSTSPKGLHSVRELLEDILPRRSEYV